MLTPNSATEFMPGTTVVGMPSITLADGRIIKAPHPEWLLHQLRWRWLLDSWEGGEVYRMAVYGFDIHGMPVRNLIRHKREYPSPFDQTWAVQTGRPAGTDQAAQATDDDYEMRRARTPVPTFLAETVETHLSRIYKGEITREGPPALEEWWEDVDGLGASIDSWMTDTIAPLLTVLGQLDILIEHPAAPKDEEVKSQADVDRLGLDQVIAGYILPENMIWWCLNAQRQYDECVVREVRDDLSLYWRHWDAKAWSLFDRHGKMVEGPTSHPFGRVPIVRLFDRRRPRAKNIGLPRYEGIAEIQREFYNRDSELILSDTTQAHPLLQGPEDYCTPDGKVPIGPNWMLPKRKDTTGTSSTYEGFDVLEFPKAGADSIRLNKADLRDAADRSALLTKPAGAAGTDGQTVAQSGVSKQLDQSSGNDLLSKIAMMLARAETQIAELALLVIGNGNTDPEEAAAVKVAYPKEYELWSASEMGGHIAKTQDLLAGSGRAPAVEGPMLKRFVRQVLPGLDDEVYEPMDKQIDDILAIGYQAASQPIDGVQSASNQTSTAVSALQTQNTSSPMFVPLED